ncbi:hypothetical protein [Streptomyces fulvoviolaceus]|uniref:hypothetical protein n=1 Tax=Streptomyces fulvoviolaceus TaxID=285535 RepID=UPI00131C82B7
MRGLDSHRYAGLAGVAAFGRRAEELLKAGDVVADPGPGHQVTAVEARDSLMEGL